MAKFEEGNDLGQKFRAGEEQSEIAKKGGKASGESRRKAKSIKEAIKILLEMEQKEGRTGAENVAVGQYNKAIKGDTAAAKFLAEMLGEYKQKVSLGGDGTPFELKVVQTTPDLKDKVNGYLDGSGLDGEGF